MNLIEHIQSAFINYLAQEFSVSKEKARSCSLIINTDENKLDFGDLNTNAALALAKDLKKNPREIATTIATNFTLEMIEKIEIAGAGFINIFLKNPAWQEITRELSTKNQEFFKPATLEKKQKFNVEFVSANPTGPLHFGHGRSGVIGDVLANVLRFLGHSVTKEFYINDAGNQIQKLGLSFKARVEQNLGMPAFVPEDGYQGEYLIDLAQECVDHYGADVVKNDLTFFENYAKEKLLERIKQTLLNYGIVFDVWFSEKTLHTSKSIHNAVERLEKAGCLYEQDGALWFKSTEFGDDKDRVIRKQTGKWTYIGADIAYLENKVERGFNPLIMVIGHDHHSYAIRLEGIRQALGLSTINLTTILYQLVRMKEGGELVQMSKRTGKMITLQDVIDAVGTDVARFFYLHRKADAHLEFDLDLARKKTDENPVYYIQYAYVRINSILQKACEEKTLQNITAEDARHIGKTETMLLKKIISLKQLIELIGTNYQTHLLTYYCIELADLYHRYYSLNRIIELENVEQSRGRLLLMVVLKDTFKTALDLLGISTPEKM